MPPPPTSNALIIHTWSQQRQVSAMEVTRGPRNSIRINFGVGGVMGVVLTLGNILRRRHASTPRYRPKIPSSDIQEGAEAARACAMAGVVRYIEQTWS